MFILTGLLIGIGLGLLISLVVFPVKYSNIAPDLLGNSQKEHYRALIATSYNARGDLGRAKARLALLKDNDTIRKAGRASPADHRAGWTSAGSTGTGNAGCRDESTNRRAAY